MASILQSPSRTGLVTPQSSAELDEILLGSHHHGRLSRRNSIERQSLLPHTDSACNEFENEDDNREKAAPESKARFLSGLAFVYFFIGMTDFVSIAVTFFEKDVLNLSVSLAQMVDSLTSIAWMIKPLFGFISDSFPICGFRRKPYLVVSSVLVLATFLFMGSTPLGVLGFLFCININNVGVVFGDVIADSLVVQKIGEGVSYGSSLQSFVWGVRMSGSIIAGWAGGMVLDSITPQQVFLIAASCSILPLIASFVIRESKVVAANGKAKAEATFQVVKLWQGVKHPLIWRAALFILLIGATPDASMAMMYFYTNALGFQGDKSFFGLKRLITKISCLVGIFLFQRFFRHIRLRPLLLWSTLFGTALQLTNLIVVLRLNVQWGISDRYFVIGDSSANALVGQMQLMPVLILAAKICPKGVEGTMYALLMSISNLGGMASGNIGALLTNWLGVTPDDFSNLWLLVLICCLCQPLPLMLLGWVPNCVPSEMDNDTTHNNNTIGGKGDARRSPEDESLTSSLLYEDSATEEGELKLLENHRPGMIGRPRLDTVSYSDNDESAERVVKKEHGSTKTGPGVAA